MASGLQTLHLMRLSCHNSEVKDGTKSRVSRDWNFLWILESSAIKSVTKTFTLPQFSLPFWKNSATIGLSRAFYPVSQLQYVSGFAESPGAEPSIWSWKWDEAGVPASYHSFWIRMDQNECPCSRQSMGSIATVSNGQILRYIVY